MRITVAMAAATSMYASVSSDASHAGGDVGPAGGGGGGVVPYNLSNRSGKWSSISGRFPDVSQLNGTRGRDLAIVDSTGKKKITAVGFYI